MTDEDKIKEGLIFIKRRLAIYTNKGYIKEILDKINELLDLFYETDNMSNL